MDSGAYRNKVMIEKFEPSHDKIGNSKGKWNECHTFYAYVNGLTSREYWIAAAVKEETTVEFIARWKNFFGEMNPKEYRLLLKGKIYNIKSIENIQNRNKTVKIRAVKKR